MNTIVQYIRGTLPVRDLRGLLHAVHSLKQQHPHFQVGTSVSHLDATEHEKTLYWQAAKAALTQLPTFAGQTSPVYIKTLCALIDENKQGLSNTHQFTVSYDICKVTIRQYTVTDVWLNDRQNNTRQNFHFTGCTKAPDTLASCPQTWIPHIKETCLCDHVF